MNATKAKNLLLEASTDDLRSVINRLGTATLTPDVRFISAARYEDVEAEVAKLRDGWIARVGDVGDRSPTRRFVFRIGSSEEIAVRDQGRILHAQGVFDDACHKTLHVDFDGEQWRLVTLEENPEGAEHLVRTHRVLSHEPGTAEHEYRTYYHLVSPLGDKVGLKSWQPLISRYVRTHEKELPETPDDGVGSIQEDNAEGAAE